MKHVVPPHSRRVPTLVAVFTGDGARAISISFRSVDDARFAADHMMKSREDCYGAIVHHLNH